MTLVFKMRPTLLLAYLYMLFALIVTVTGRTADGNGTCVCGRVNPTIWYGETGTISPLYYPWAVSITDAVGKSICGGILLNKYEVLTAGHCLNGKTKDEIALILGVHDVSRAVASDKYRVKSFVIHQDFEEKSSRSIVTFENDLAVIRMEKPLKAFLPNIRPICFPKYSVNYEKRGDVIVLGWGQLSADLDNTAQKLQMLEQPLLSLEYCQQAWNTTFVPGRHLCMGEGGHNICKGDEGGPLMVENSHDRFDLIGIASYSGPVCGDEKPGVYSSFEYYRNWITKNSLGPGCYD